MEIAPTGLLDLVVVHIPASRVWTGLDSVRGYALLAGNCCWGGQQRTAVVRDNSAAENRSWISILTVHLESAISPGAPTPSCTPTSCNQGI